MITCTGVGRRGKSLIAEELETDAFGTTWIKDSLMAHAGD